MSTEQWIIHYLNRDRIKATSRTMPSKEAALRRARDLIWQRCTVCRILNQHEVVDKLSIEEWAKANPGGPAQF
jgi:hypothetical protein